MDALSIGTFRLAPADGTVSVYCDALDHPEHDRPGYWIGRIDRQGVMDLRTGRHTGRDVFSIPVDRLYRYVQVFYG